MSDKKFFEVGLENTLAVSVIMEADTPEEAKEKVLKLFDPSRFKIKGDLPRCVSAREVVQVDF